LINDTDTFVYSLAHHTCKNIGRLDRLLPEETRGRREGTTESPFIA